LNSTTPKTYQLLLPLVFLFILISFGLVIGPNYFGMKPFPLEIIFLLAAIFSATELMVLGYKWKDIQDAIVKKLTQGFPVSVFLFYWNFNRFLDHFRNHTNVSLLRN
jgi:NhaC family Na+:H+ antiporter